MSRLYKLTVGQIFTRAYSPDRVLDLSRRNTDKVRILSLSDEETESGCRLFDIDEGCVFTDRYTHIGISQEKFLIPGASWQWEQGKLVNPEQNPVLRQGTPKPLKYYEGTVLSLLSGGGGNSNYYHWLYDVLPRIYLCEELVGLDNIDYFLVPENSFSFQKSTLEALGIDREKLISSKDVQHLGCKRLIATNHPNSTHFDVPKWVVQWLRRKFLPLAETVDFEFRSKLSSYVYISRGDTPNKRNILNEKEVISFLKQKGFTSYKLADLSLPEQICLFSNAKVIVGAHGAGLSNLAFSSPATRVVEIFSNLYSPSFGGIAPRMYEKISEKNLLNYTSLISNHVEENPSSPLCASFFITPEEVSRVVFN